MRQRPQCSMHEPVDCLRAMLHPHSAAHPSAPATHVATMRCCAVFCRTGASSCSRYGSSSEITRPWCMRCAIQLRKEWDATEGEPGAAMGPA